MVEDSRAIVRLTEKPAATRPQQWVVIEDGRIRLLDAPFRSTGEYEEREFLSQTALAETLPSAEMFEAGLVYTVNIIDSDAAVHSLELTARSATMDATAYTCIGDAPDSSTIQYGFCIASMPGMGNVFGITDEAVFVENFGIESIEKAAAISITYMAEKCKRLDMKYLPFTVKQVTSEADMLSLDFSKFEPGEIIMLVSEVEAGDVSI